jgi:hypothetical protein
MLSQQLARTECAGEALNSISLRLRNDVRIQLKRDSWVAVSQLCADGGDARALVNQRRSDTMPNAWKPANRIPNDNSNGRSFFSRSLFAENGRPRRFANRSPWPF